MADAVVSTVDAVTEEDRITLAPGWQQTVVSVAAALGNHVFDYGHRVAVDQMQTSWEKLVQLVGTNYKQDCNMRRARDRQARVN
jgi:hypothetical protein